MWKPIGIIIGVVLLIGFATCAVQKAYIETARSTGKPLDHLGMRTPCPLCNPPGSGKIIPGSMAEAWEGYDYRCRRCGHEFRARWNEADRRTEVDW